MSLKILISLTVCIFTTYCHAQLSIDTDGTSQIVDFEQSVPGVNTGRYLAANPPSALPLDGDLHSAAWSIQGFDSPADSARGVDIDGNVTEGGVYAFVVNLDTFFGLQPTDPDFTPGSITLTVVNNSGGSINSFNLLFDRWVHNDQDRSNALHVDVSTNGIDFVNIPNLSDTSMELAAATPAFIASSVSEEIVLAEEIPDEDTLYIRWWGEDIDGMGARDEFGIDDIQITSAVLPIQLTYFRAEAVDNGKEIELKWETASEINNDHFLIEKSLDGEAFRAFHSVVGKGNSTKSNQYHAIDPEPVKGINYYRLIQYDLDGRRNEHGIVSVEMAESHLSVYPTIATNHIFISGIDQTDLSIIDSQGRLVRHTPSLPAAGRLDISNYPLGTYYLVSINKFGHQEVVPFIKI